MQLQRVIIPKYVQCQSCNKGFPLTEMTVCVSNDEILQKAKEIHGIGAPLCLAFNPLIIIDNALINSDIIQKAKVSSLITKG